MKKIIVLLLISTQLPYLAQASDPVVYCVATIANQVVYEGHVSNEKPVSIDSQLFSVDSEARRDSQVVTTLSCQPLKCDVSVKNQNEIEIMNVELIRRYGQKLNLRVGDSRSNSALTLNCKVFGMH